MNSKLNLKSRTMVLLAGGLLSAGALVGCVSEEDNGPQPVQHQTAHQALGANIQIAVDDLNQALGYLRSDTKFGVATAVGELDQQADDCSDPFDEFGFDDCEPREAVSAEEQLQDTADELIDKLNARLFAQGNIEDETDTQITYLVDGATFCADEADEECTENIDALQLRLLVTSPASGDIDISVRVGEARYNPLDVELHRAKIAAEFDLGDILPTIELIGRIDGDPIDDLPSLMQGRVRAEFAHTAQRATATLDIQEKIVVSGNEWSIKADTAAPAARLSIDSGAHMLQALLALKPVEIKAPVTTHDYIWNDDGSETETTTQYDVFAQLAGASFDLEYLVRDDHLEISNIGLGDAQSTLDIDGKRVLEVDLNADDGRALSLSIDALGDDGAEIAFSPGFDLAVMLKFVEVQQHFDDLSDWMLNDTLRIVLNGATTPKLRIEDGDVEVLDGTLSISSSAADIDVQVNAGQCVLDDYDINDDDGDFDDDDFEEEHPFSDISAGTCE